MTRVLHINDYPLDAGGGAEVVTRRTVELLRQRGVTTATFTRAEVADPRLTPLRYLDNPQARLALAALLDVFRPHIVHLHNWYHVLSPSILAALADHKRRQPMRVVMTAHDYHLVCPNAGGSWFRRWAGQREAIARTPIFGATLLARRWDERSEAHSLLKVLQHVWNYRWLRRQRVIDLVICPSRFVQAMLAPTGLATCCLPHPAPVAASRERQRARSLRFVFAGRLEPEKGLCEFLQLLPDDFDADLTVIGDGSARAACAAISAARNFRVEFTGRLSHAETLARIAECHVLVQPTRVLETYGLTLIEALAVGTNLLVADHGAAREIVDDAGVGFLFNVDDRMGLAEQLGQIQRRHVDGSLNRFDIAAFLSERSEAAYVERLLELYGVTNLARRAA